MNIFSLIQKELNKWLTFIKDIISLHYRSLTFAGKDLPIEERLSDFFEVFKTTRLFLFFNLLGIVVFNFLPQGKDVILSVIEDCRNLNFGTLFSLLVGLTGWCIVSEFGARYKIYVSDNSGLSLTDERVVYRKEAQKVVSSLYLLFPILIVFLSVIIVSFSTLINWELKTGWPIIVVLILLFVLFTTLSKYYLDFDFVDGKINEGVWYKIERNELQWAEKLLGIYNNYVLMVRKSSNYKGPDDKFTDTTENQDGKKNPPPPDYNIYHAYLRFTEKIDQLQNNGPYSKSEFPTTYLKSGELPPDEFRPVVFKEENKKIKKIKETINGKNSYRIEMENNPDGYYRWIFKCNKSFYKSLHKQIHIIALSSIAMILFMCLPWHPNVFVFIGSPALVCLAFASWLGIYTGVLYLDYRYRNIIKFPLRWILFLWFLFVSLINNDHPVRSNEFGKIDNRYTLKEHFHKWVLQNNITGNDTVKIFLVTAEGGALRTGAYTAFVLSKIADNVKDLNFENKIYAYSSVSGGTLGVGFFNAISHFNNTPKKNGDWYSRQTKEFFRRDMLAPVLAKMFYSDILNGFWPASIKSFDKAIVLEKAWENSYYETLKPTNSENIFSADFLNKFTKETNPSNKSLYPIWLINTTEVETGRQAIVSNVKLDEKLISPERDIIASKFRFSINYSTAINFSTRFPLVSPPAAIKRDDNTTFHYVDGGYVENTGMKSMYELLYGLKDTMANLRIVPFVISIRFGEDSGPGNTNFLNEVSGIVNGIYNVRQANTEIYSKSLTDLVQNLGGDTISLRLSATQNQVPMNWVFSDSSLNFLENYVNSTLLKPTSELSTFLNKFRSPSGKVLLVKDSTKTTLDSLSNTH